MSRDGFREPSGELPPDPVELPASRTHDSATIWKAWRVVEICMWLLMTVGMIWFRGGGANSCDPSAAAGFPTAGASPAQPE